MRIARCSPFVISKVLSAHMRKFITARARKNKRTARMLANAHKDHSIPLVLISGATHEAEYIIIKAYIIESTTLYPKTRKLPVLEHKNRGYVTYFTT